MPNEAIRKNGMFLLPCGPDVCQECAVKHGEGEAHNKQSLYYQYKFYAKHGRFPTWKDAVAHCTKEIQEAWKKELTALGKWTESENKKEL